MKTTKNLRPNIAAPVARTTGSTSSKGAAVNASWIGSRADPFAGDDAE